MGKNCQKKNTVNPNMSSVQQNEGQEDDGVNIAATNGLIHHNGGLLWSKTMKTAIRICWRQEESTIKMKMQNKNYKTPALIIKVFCLVTTISWDRWFSLKNVVVPTQILRT